MIYRDSGKYVIKLNRDIVDGVWGVKVMEERLGGDIVRVPIEVKKSQAK